MAIDHRTAATTVGDSGPGDGRDISRRGSPTSSPRGRAASRRDRCARRRPRPRSASFLTTWASAASMTASGVRIRSAAWPRKPERSPFVTAGKASRKSGIRAGQAEKNVVKSWGWCSLPRTGCPRTREAGVPDAPARVLASGLLALRGWQQGWAESRELRVELALATFRVLEGDGRGPNKSLGFPSASGMLEKIPPQNPSDPVTSRVGCLTSTFMSSNVPSGWMSVVPRCSS